MSRYGSRRSGRPHEVRALAVARARLFHEATQATDPTDALAAIAAGEQLAIELWSATGGHAKRTHLPDHLPAMQNPSRLEDAWRVRDTIGSLAVEFGEVI
jgi:hypothetical protein